MGGALGISRVTSFADVAREVDQIQSVRASSEYL
jgi:hypothetical protein